MAISYICFHRIQCRIVAPNSHSLTRVALGQLPDCGASISWTDKGLMGCRLFVKIQITHFFHLSGRTKVRWVVGYLYYCSSSFASFPFRQVFNSTNNTNVFHSPFPPHFLWDTQSATHFLYWSYSHCSCSIERVESSRHVFWDTEWCNISVKLLRNTRNACRGCHSSQSHHTDVRCCGKMVHQTRYSSRTFCVTRPWPYSF
jgi:hypothetical protein